MGSGNLPLTITQNIESDHHMPSLDESEANQVKS